MKSSRLIAFETLYKIFYDNAYSNIALDEALKEVSNDKSFVSALVYGVTERKITLDYLINKHLKSRTKPKIMTVLRLGAYQLIYMDSVPSSAAINESVKLVKEIKQDYYTKLVNAVLHKIDNDRDLPENNLSIKYSVSSNLINMWIKQYTKEKVESFLPYINGKPPVFIVPNIIKTNIDDLQNILFSEGIKTIKSGELLMIEGHFDLKNLNSFNDGLFHVEDMSSYNCACELSACAGDVVFDMCSAPGGKAFTVSERMNNKGTVYCFDLYDHRVNKIKDGAERLGITCIKADVNDACKYNENLPKADCILCDVVCSGFGIIRRKPEIKYKELDDVKDLPKIQYQILETSSRYLKVGGRLVYSTCTLNKKENEKVVSLFLNKNNNFELKSEKTVFPSLDGGDGFYTAVLIKNEN